MYVVHVDGKGSKTTVRFKTENIEYVANGNVVRLLDPVKDATNSFDDEELGDAVDFPLNRVQRVDTM